jgi:hypothetical protein
MVPKSCRLADLGRFEACTIGDLGLFDLAVPFFSDSFESSVICPLLFRSLRREEIQEEWG